MMQSESIAHLFSALSKIDSNFPKCRQWFNGLLQFIPHGGCVFQECLFPKRIIEIRINFSSLVV
jgi:hypothetical protein